MAASPKNTLNPAYRVKCRKLPSLSNAMFSAEKVEKVVNPPQKPTVRKSLNSLFDKFPRSERPNSKPIRKHPKMFTHMVPNGKAEATLFWIAREIR